MINLLLSVKSIKSNFYIYTIPNDKIWRHVTVFKISSNYCMIYKSEKTALASMILSANPRYSLTPFVAGVVRKPMDDDHFLAAFICCPDNCQLKNIQILIFKNLLFYSLISY